MIDTAILSHNKEKVIAKSIENRMAAFFDKAFNIKGQACFSYDDDNYFIISGIPWEDGRAVILAEYAFSKDEAVNNMFEDGEMFDIDEMTEDEIFDAILDEIKSA